VSEETVVTEKAPIDPVALRAAREQARLSKRELGRRVAEHLGDHKAARAIQMRLSRLERGDEVTKADRKLIEALAAELAVGTDDLGERHLWIWVRLHNGRPGIVELGMRFPCYSTAEDAYRQRDLLAHSSGGIFTPFKDAQLVPMRVTTIRQDVLDENYPELSDAERELLIVENPGKDVLPYLAALNDIMNSDELEDWKLEGVVNAIEMFNLLDETARLHTLATRRLVIPTDNAELLASWRLREQRLYDVLDLHHQRTMLRHERTQANVSPLQ
jgi:transcriptional regulator with XRE-family HTH domain